MMMTPNVPTTILRNLLTNDEYTRKTIPFLKKEYFEGAQRFVFDEILNFVGKYNKLPTPEALSIELDNANLNEQTHIQAHEVVETIKTPVADDIGWLLEHTEKWCQDRAIYLAIMKSIEIIDGRDDQNSKNSLPEILSDALSVSFDTNIGHDYIKSADARYEFYHTTEEKLPFDLEKFNSITKGGLPRKSLNIALAGTGVGKSLFMCHCAAGALTDGKNVLYLTMEMSEERIAERIDANLFNVEIDQLENLSKKMFDDKINKISSKTLGNLIIKEYPTGSAHVGHFRSLLNELKLKKEFMPDIIFIDYLNICASSRIKGLSGSVNTYSLIKSVAEEIRGLAVEYNVPIMSATQTTRTGYGSSDVGLEDTSESFGLPATADLMFALISNEELEGLNQILVKQLKNRYNDTSVNKRFIVGVDRARMRLYDVEDSAQNLVDAGQQAVVPNTNKPKMDVNGFNFNN
jgi:replicative DNA helicase|tara:strand:+ start:78 stop:1463 length:1386 start_codon:yes stop_codon:yes gene_type:complete